MAGLSPVGFLRRAADVWPGQVAVVDDGGISRTYRAFRERADRLADALRSSGVRPGDRVAVLAPNGAVPLEAHFGVPGSGGVLVMLNTRLGPEEYGYILRHAGARLAIVHPDHVDAVAALRRECPELERIVVIGDEYEAWTAAASGTGMGDPADERDLIALNYTSGTTGRPKGVMYTHRGAYLNALGDVITFGLAPSTVYLWTLPMFHCNGWCFTWAVTAAGGRHVCLPRPDPGRVLEVIAREQVTHLCGAPVVISGLAHHSLAAEARFPWRVRAAVGGAPPAPQVIEAAEAMGVEILHLYGMTETYGPALVCEPQPPWRDLPLRERADRAARQGVRTVVVSEVRVVDSEGRPVPHDGRTMGEIVVDSATVMAGYFGEPEATQEALRDGWLHTGDLAVVHDDGYIDIRDRAKDIIVSGGENISSVEVEHVLLDHPEVIEAAVVACPDERWGEVPVAFVTLVEGANVTEAELVGQVRERLAHFKAPRRVIVAELPRTATGKVRKAELRSRAAGAVER